jgi:glutathione synthase/RimK-type ligase-like ATP-grasp enzyme
MAVTMRKRCVLIVTHRLAQEVDGVIDKLRSSGVEVYRWNLCQFPEELSTSISRSGISVAGKQFNKIIPDACWLHDTGSFTTATSLVDIDHEASKQECEAFWDGILTRIGYRWINDPLRVRLASLKIHQLQVAENLGIPVPDYLATNDMEAAHAFVKNKKLVVAKAVRGGFLVHGKRSIKFLTHRVTDILPQIIEGLRYSPVLFQEEIVRDHEVRVTVVDDSQFSVAVNCKNLPDDIVDIRELDYEKHRHRFARAVNVQKIEKWSHEIVAALGLSYGGLDWAIAVDGTPYFLECNPLGSFKWNELVSGMDITGAIAAALRNRAFAPIDASQNDRR